MMLRKMQYQQFLSNSNLKKMKQTQKVLNVLKNKGEIYNLDAIYDMFILRLGARIKDLRNQGYIIHTDKSEPNCRYWIDKKLWKKNKWL